MSFISIFNCKRLQFRALRNAGVDRQQITRAAGTPAFLSSNENFGLSDTALHASRTSVAAAACTTLTAPVAFRGLRFALVVAVSVCAAAVSARAALWGLDAWSATWRTAGCGWRAAGCGSSCRCA